VDGAHAVALEPISKLASGSIPRLDFKNGMPVEKYAPACRT